MNPGGATCWNSAGANVGTRYVVKNGASTISKLASAQPSRVSGAYVGNCLNFLGDSYVSVPSYPGIEFTTGSFSIDAWVSWTGSFGGSEAILFKRGITSVFPLRYRATRSMLTTMDHLRLNCIPAAATRRSQKLPVLS